MAIGSSVSKALDLSVPARTMTPPRQEGRKVQSVELTGAELAIQEQRLLELQIENELSKLGLRAADLGNINITELRNILDLIGNAPKGDEGLKVLQAHFADLKIPLEKAPVSVIDIENAKAKEKAETAEAKAEAGVDAIIAAPAPVVAPKVSAGKNAQPEQAVNAGLETAGLAALLVAEAQAAVAEAVRTVLPKTETNLDQNKVVEAAQTAAAAESIHGMGLSPSGIMSAPQKQARVKRDRALDAEAPSPSSKKGP